MRTNRQRAPVGLASGLGRWRRLSVVNAETLAGTDFWDSVNARFTLFPTEPTDTSSVATWWDDTFGVRPETATAAPREGKASQSGVIPIGGTEIPVQLSIEPLRIDWKLLEHGPEAAFEAGGLPNPSVVYDTFAEIIKRWLPGAPPVRRIALALGLVHRTTNPDERPPLIEAFTGIPLVGEVSDFLFQLNRPRQSTAVPDLRLNRVTKWSTLDVQKIVLAIGAQRVDQVPALSLGHALRLDLEVNTDARREDPLDVKSIPDLYSEFVMLASEICEIGLRP